MSGIAPWHELTPQAQAVVREQLDRLLVHVSNAAEIRRACELDPSLIPQFVRRLS